MRENRKQFFDNLSRIYSHLIKAGYDRTLVKREIANYYGLSIGQVYRYLDTVELDTHVGEEFRLKRILSEIDDE